MPSNMDLPFCQSDVATRSLDEMRRGEGEEPRLSPVTGGKS